jgi:type IV secretion system protein VirB8
VASVKFSFSNKPINEQDRYLNPLGFQISSYRRDAETTQPVPMPAAPAPMLPAPTSVPTTGVTTVPVPGTPVNGVTSAVPAAQAPAQATPAAVPQSKSGNPHGEEFPAQ